MSSAEAKIAQAIADRSTEINLAYTGLTELPESLRRLTGVTRLDLSYNRLRELPSWIGEFGELTELDLNHNELTDVPAIVPSLITLRGLGLLGNRLDQLPAGLGRLKDLRWLVLRSNRFGTLPPVLHELHRLELLDLCHSAITELPDWIGELEHLRDLNVADAGLTDIPASLGRLTELRRLDLRGNRLTGLPAEAGALTRLDLLWLSRNGLTALPGAVRGMTALAGLAMRENQLTDLPGWIGELATLTWLAFAGNRLRSVPAALGRLPRLTELDLASNELRTLPRDLGDRTLQVLDLSDNPLEPPLQAAYDAGGDALNAYLRLLRDDDEEVREAKLILVGEGDVGKSCLLAALRGEDWTSRDTTHGIEIKPLEVHSGDAQPIRLNGWDFGGQREHRPTHQLFFTAPAVYLVVWKPRVGADRSEVRYWIELIRSRVGDSARIVVVATHRGLDEPAARLDHDELIAEFGAELIRGFHHVDSRTGDRIDELRTAIAEVAAELSDVPQRCPRPWREFRDTLKMQDEPYLRYAEYEMLAEPAGLSPKSAALLARIANQLGQWITFDDPEHKVTELVILKPDWLATAVSLIVNDEVTYAAKGLLPHGRLSRIWNDPARRHSYPPALFRHFVTLMERYELSYRVTDPAAPGEQASMIPLCLPSTRPDLQAWTAYRPELPSAEQVCEITADDAPVRLPDGLMCQLIVRFHPYSLGHDDVRNSVHWLHGMVLEDSYQGRALIEAKDNQIWVTVRGVSPGFLLYRLTEEIRQVVQKPPKTLRVTVKVPCRTCARQARNRGLFPLDLLMRVRTEDTKIRCLVCYESQRIDDLLTGVSASQLATTDAGPLAVAEIQQALREEIEPLVNTIAGITVRNERTLKSIGGRLVEHLVARDEKLNDILESIDDEVRNGPWMASIDELPRSAFRPQITKVSLRLSLWCEHARLPLSVLRDDPEAGVYDLQVPREWLVKAAPYLRLGLALLRTFVPIVGAGLDGVVPDPARGALGDQLKAAGDSLAPVIDEAGSYRALEGDPDAVVRAERPDAAVLRQLQHMIADQDPTFGGLERVRLPTGGPTRYKWVDPRFLGLYRMDVPTIP
jgi:Leucine-rich repeat (LRR) protein